MESVVIEPEYTKLSHEELVSQLHQLQQQFDEFAYHLPDALVEVDLLSGRLIYMNRTAHLLFCYTELDFAQGIETRQLFAESEYERAVEKVNDYIAKSKNFKIPYKRSEEQRLYEFLMRKKEGSSFSAETQTAFVLDKDSIPIKMRTIIRDISERKQREEKMRETEKMKSHFFANISHEFRTPLTLILAHTEKNLSRTDDEESTLALKLMQRNTKDLLRLVNQLLDLAKLEAEQVHLQTRLGDMVGCLRAATSPFSSFAASKQIALHFQAAEEPIQIYFDREKVETILGNLLFNALKFTPKGGQVSVSVVSASIQPSPENKKGVEAEGVQIVVRDTGAGIPADRLAHIFDRFSQAHVSSRHEYQSTGLGLSLVKELVALHHGTVQVESEEGLGATFTVFLPRGKEYFNEKEVIGSATLSQKGDVSAELHECGPDETISISENCTTNRSDDTLILVIEDHADLRAYIRECLEPAYKVLEAEDGAAGIAKALRVIPDLVVSDVMMPKQDGYEVCKNLKTDERTSHIPVILLTAKAAKKEKMQGLETGADDYLIKPFDSQELLVRIKNLIDLRRKLRDRYRSTILLKPSEIAANSLDEVFLKKILESVEKHLGDENFDVETLSRDVAMSQSQVYRKLRALTNQPTVQVIQSVRLQRAADLLRQKSGTIAEITYSVGFSNQAYFTKCFREKFGCTPLKYMRDHNFDL